MILRDRKPKNTLGYQVPVDSVYKTFWNLGIPEYDIIHLSWTAESG